MLARRGDYFTSGMVADSQLDILGWVVSDVFMVYGHVLRQRTRAFGF